MYKIIGADHKEYGPISAEQLRQWISEGRANAATRVQAEGSNVWKALAEYPEFGLSIPPTPPPLSLPVSPASATNQLALWAMITGLFSLLCCSVLGPLPIILGFIALSQIKAAPGQGGTGFAITGIVTGVVAIVIAVLSIIIFTRSPEILQNLQNSLSH
ncbi:MAG TPA: DUF4190 domain-containing protein [Verrucomicrobiae bacterium]|jgi:hypothetical protein|nr:DUF4190 domain-containing protein [Verrucomicrobiae bacterium]